MAKHHQPAGLPEGIYFDLHEDEYHADPALSHSGMVDLLSHPLDYWTNSPLNPARAKFGATEAMIFGKRCHALLLEGNAFFDRYYVHGMKYDNTKQAISSDSFKKIRDSVTRIRETEIGNEYFSNGYPEVSFFWRDPSTGIMLRSRVDYLRTFGIIDYKRIKAIGFSTIGSAIADQGLDIQRALYIAGATRMRTLLRQKKCVVQGDPDPDWLEAFTKDKDMHFRFFFQRSTPPYVWKLHYLDPEIIRIGEDSTATAIKIYKHNIEKYGVAEWPAGTGEAEEFSIFHVPKRIYDRAI